MFFKTYLTNALSLNEKLYKLNFNLNSYASCGLYFHYEYYVQNNHNDNDKIFTYKYFYEKYA